jgi:hypothetical protein
MNSHPQSRLFAQAACLLLALPAAALASPVTVSQSVDPEADVMLQSYQSGGQTFNNFILVNNAQTIFTSPENPAQPHKTLTGTLSVDKGLRASGVGPFENPTDAEITANLSNLNLNNVMDVEEDGRFGLNTTFSRAVKDNHAGADSAAELLIFERGRNSDLNVQALDANGNPIGNELTLLRNGRPGSNQVDAGFQIHTSETGQQHVGLWAIDLDQLGVTSLSGLRVGTPRDSGLFNGPDFKIIGVDTGTTGPGTVQNAPEPSAAALTVAAVVAWGLSRWRRRLVRKWGRASGPVPA